MLRFRIDNQQFFAAGDSFLNGFFRRFIICNDNIQLFQTDGIAQRIHIPFGVIQKEYALVGDGDKRFFSCGHSLGMFKCASWYAEGTTRQKSNFSPVIFHVFLIRDQDGAVAVMHQPCRQENLNGFPVRESHGGRQAGRDDRQREVGRQQVDQLLDRSTGIQTNAFIRMNILQGNGSDCFFSLAFSSIDRKSVV